MPISPANSPNSKRSPRSTPSRREVEGNGTIFPTISPPISPPRSPLAMVGRFGVTQATEPRFCSEERFADYANRNPCDNFYDLPDSKSKMSAFMGKSQRVSMSDTLPNSSGPEVGPGKYNIEYSLDVSSEHMVHNAPKFGSDVRQSLELKTPSPGAVYDTEGLNRFGRDKTIKISFNCDDRPPLHYPICTKNVDFFTPSLPKGRQASFGRRLPEAKKGVDTPGAIYDGYKKVGFRTGPSFSFGASTSSRFEDKKVERPRTTATGK
jgi:hypothetical protein